MTTLQKLRLRLSEVRQRLNAISGIEGDAFTDEIRAEAETLQTEYADLETRHRAAIVAEGEDETRATEGPDAERRERLELRSRASLTTYLRAALPGGQETRADAATGAPGVTGINLDRIRPAVFSASIANKIGVEMPRVESGSYASATITTSLSAAS